MNIISENDFTRSLARLGKTAPNLAKFAIESVKRTPVRCNNDWGVDHASWSVLKHMYPQADIPVFEMSLDYSFNDWNPKRLQYHYEVAKGLTDLRKNGVLIMASGNIVHNLRLIDFGDVGARPFHWAVEFDKWASSNLLDGNHQELINCEQMGQQALYAMPTLDHYLPMIYAIALQEEDDALTFSHEGFQNGCISMRCFQIG